MVANRKPSSRYVSHAKILTEYARREIALADLPVIAKGTYLSCSKGRVVEIKGICSSDVIPAFSTSSPIPKDAQWFACISRRLVWQGVGTLLLSHICEIVGTLNAGTFLGVSCLRFFMDNFHIERDGGPWKVEYDFSERVVVTAGGKLVGMDWGIAGFQIYNSRDFADLFECPPSSLTTSH